jgi:hypothetical protein
MEWLTIALSAFLTLITPAGAIIDSVIAGTIRSRMNGVESLAVRVDNTPSYAALQGKVDRVRIAGRGIYPISGVRIQAIDLETDPIDVDLGKLQGQRANPISALRKPAGAAIRLVLSEEDINKAFQSPEIQQQVQRTIDRLVPRSEESGGTFQLKSARIDFQENNRVSIALELQAGDASDPLNLSLTSRLNVVGGRKIEILDPTGTLNGRRLSGRLLKGFADGLAERFDLANFEKDGIFARLLQLRIDDDKLQVAVFARVTPRSGNPIAP